MDLDPLDAQLQCSWGNRGDGSWYAASEPRKNVEKPYGNTVNYLRVAFRRSVLNRRLRALKAPEI